MDKSRFDVPLFCDSQSQKDCKKTTPDGGDVAFKKGELVALDGAVSLVNKKVLTGTFTFDSYDKYDNTVYVEDASRMSFNVLWSDLKKIETKKKK